MHGVAEVLAVEDAARDVALGEDGRLLRHLDAFERADQLEVAGAVRLRHALKLALDERRDDGAVLAQLALPPADRQVAAERLAVVEVGADDRGLKVDALLHGWAVTTGALPFVSSSFGPFVCGSRRMTARAKSKVRR